MRSYFFYTPFSLLDNVNIFDINQADDLVSFLKKYTMVKLIPAIIIAIILLILFFLTTKKTPKSTAGAKIAEEKEVIETMIEYLKLQKVSSKTSKNELCVILASNIDDIKKFFTKTRSRKFILSNINTAIQKAAQLYAASFT